ncbi:serine/threonine-protein kinase [Catenulispora pinisilvae]|uniref:serine/threonine-protein kinase n=1 Tax=Catenulispora pinisilvae TaxID=2705253 RepID=UPI0018918854|nr:serine/threonine-protein kinase [Catenulispora pinisilvae]
MDRDSQPGTILAGRYRLTRVIGTGGFGRVWEADDEQLQRSVAIKEVMLSLLPPEQQRERLERALREGRNAAALADHPHIVSVYDGLIEDGKPWIVMQLVRGVSLRQKLLSDPDDPASAKVALDSTTVTRIAEGILSALAALHTAKILHRDVKPGNILLADDGQVLLTDFGIAKAEADATVTVSGSFMGTMAYTAPERAEGVDDDPKSDLFSLGVTLFEAVEGVSPFEKNTKTSTLTAILTKPLPPMSRAGKLAPLITALTLKLPQQRPTVAQAQALLSGKGSGGWTAPSPDDVTTEAVAPHAKATPGPAGQAKLPWESVTLGGSAGLPRPPVVSMPQPQAPGAAVPPQTPNWAGIAGVIGVVAAILIGLGWWNDHQHNQPSANQQPTPPPTTAVTTSYVVPTDPVTTDLVTVTTSAQTTPSVNMTAGCQEANDALAKENKAVSAAPNSSTDPVGAMAALTQAASTATDDYNNAAGLANDPAVRTAIQNLATNAAETSSALTQLSSDNNNHQDITSDKANVTDLTGHLSALNQDLLHACQNAAHD